MKTYRTLLAEIERLQRKAEVLRRAELKGVIKHIRELIAKHGLTGSDLGLDGAKAPKQFQDLLAAAPARGRKPGKAAKAATSKGVARYRDPATGKTWTGRGKPPNWIVGAKDRSAFEIGPGAAEPAAPKGAKAAKAVKAVKAKKAPKASARKASGAKAVAPADKPAAKKAAKKAAGKAAARKAAVKRAAPAKAAKPAKAPKTPKSPKATKATKAAKLPRPPVPKATGKKAKAPKVAAPAPAPADGGSTSAPTPSAE